MPLPYAAFDNWFYYAHERLGADSEFDAEHNVYVEMVRNTMLRLPKGWEERAVERVLRAGTNAAVTVVYPELHDLLASKLIAGRAQDLAFLQGVRHLLQVDNTTLRMRLKQIKLTQKQETLRSRANKSITNI